MNERDNLKRVAIKTNLTDDWNSYRLHKNHVNNEIRKAKKKYYEEHLSQVSGNPRETWKTINNILSRNKNNAQINSIKKEQNVVKDVKIISDLFNDHFSNIGPTLALSIPEGPIGFTAFLKKANSTFSMMHTNVDEITKIVNSLDINKATGLDDIPIKLIKKCPIIVYQKLVELFNQSMDCGIFPFFRQCQKYLKK